MAIGDYPNFVFQANQPLGQLQERFQGIQGSQGSYSGMMNQCAASAAVLPAGNMILTLASEVASRAESLAARLSDHLSVIVGPESTECDRVPPPNQPLPPYFEELRSRLLHINRTLDVLESLNERIAL